MRNPRGNGRVVLTAATVALFALLSFAQVPPPGSPQPDTTPPQPGQVGPAPKTLPASEPESQPPSQTTIPGAQGNQPATPGETATFTAPVHNVMVPTTVLDPDGHGYVNGLRKEDFEVFDNDKAQRVDADYTEQPASVVLVLQANSEVEPMIPTLRRSGVLLHGLVTGQEGDAAVLAFDHRMQVLQDFTNDAQRLDDAMQKLSSGSSTAALIDAVMKADRMLVDHDRSNVRRRVIILVSRNQDKGSETHIQEAVRKMQFDNVIVYAVDMSKLKTALLKRPDYPGRQNGGVPPEALPNITGHTMTDTDVISQENGNLLDAGPAIGRNVRDLFRNSAGAAFTSFTGGNLYTFSNLKGLEAAITDIGKDLNSQYLLSYSPNNSKEPGFHHIRVVVNRPGLQVRTRPGYWWGGGQQ